MKIKEFLGSVPVPAWAFTAFMGVYNEGMLHLWITEELLIARLAAVTAFALGLGLVLGLLVSFLPGKAGKWAAVAVSLVVTVVMLVEFFVSDAYQVFMTPETIFSGASGVAQDYSELVMSLVLRDLWRIALMLLPILLYGLFCANPSVGWPLRAALAAGAVVLYLLGLNAVRIHRYDLDKLDTAYNFDSAVRSFGVNMALTLETVRGGGKAGEPEFISLETQATLPPETEPAETTRPAEETEAAETTEATEPPVVYGENILEELDLEALANTTPHRGMAAVHRYVNGLTPSKQNAYTALFEGKNLILITAEAFSKEVIDPQLTPTLYRMATKGIRFEEYYQPLWGASTTSGEFSNVVGLVPTTGGKCMKEAVQQNLFLTMGNQLQEQGYFSRAYHNHLKDFYDRDKTHTHLGYDEFLGLYGGLEGVDPVWPESDLQMIDVTVPQYIDNQPFSVYYMTVSGHCVYTLEENVQSRNHYEEVKGLDCSETLKYYLASQLELEHAMSSLLRQLTEAGIADDTVVVISSDHYPYGLEPSRTWKNDEDFLAELYGVESYDNLYQDHNALIIWSGCLEDMEIVVEEPVYSLDILPTLSNLFGLEYDSRLLVGRDVFSDTEPLVLWPNYSWITDKASYNTKTGEFTVREEVQLPEGYKEYIDTLVKNKISYCNSVMELNYFNYIAEALGRER